MASRNQFTWLFLNGIRRDFELNARHGGYVLKVPGGRGFGLVRFNVGGRHQGNFRVYLNDRHFNQRRHDPRRVFRNNSPSDRSGRGWTCLVDPDDGVRMRYVMRVLEGCCDRALAM